MDSWFDSWQAFLASRQQRLPAFMTAWPGTLPLLAVTLPLFPVALLLWLVSGQLMGLLSFGLHLCLVMYCLPRVNLDALIEDYLERWNRGNFEAAYLHSENLVPGLFDESFDDYARMHAQFSRFVLVCSFRRVLAVLFWYILAGPLGALFYVLVQLAVNSGLLLTQPQAQWLAHKLLALLDWLPVRMVAMAFALAGDFVAGFNKLRARLLEPLDDELELDLLDECAQSAINPAGLMDKDTEFAVRAGAELAELRALLQRTQIVWVAVLALIVLVV
ncbi:MAG: regulatory signaling modulator protein AmpE [Gammaproteobacteria bacterium]|nr:regulatory signaling modulator protein AmpE [Gammaproteobacteria bacterium]